MGCTILNVCETPPPCSAPYIRHDSLSPDAERTQYSDNNAAERTQYAANPEEDEQRTQYAADHVERPQNGALTNKHRPNPTPVQERPHLAAEVQRPPQASHTLNVFERPVHSGNKEMLRNSPIDTLGAYGFFTTGIGFFMLPPCTLLYINYRDLGSPWRTPILLLLLLSIILMIFGSMFIITWCFKANHSKKDQQKKTSDLESLHEPVFVSANSISLTKSITVESKPST